MSGSDPTLSYPPQPSPHQDQIFSLVPDQNEQMRWDEAMAQPVTKDSWCCQTACLRSLGKE